MFSNYIECKLAEDTHIRSKTIKVMIPSFFPDSKNRDDPQETIVNTTQANRVYNTNKDAVKETYETTNVIEALNHTDYAYKLKGDVFKKRMEYTDGITELRAGGGGYAEYASHDHDIKKPITLYNFVYENLNNVIVKKGTLAYGFFINGAGDTTRFAVTHIEDAVPLEDSDPIAYQK